MPAAGLLKYFHLAYFSKPAHHRPLYRAIRRSKPRRIVELGTGTADRAAQMIAVAALCQSDLQEPVRYTGIDLFEARPQNSPGLSLKQAHRLLGSSGALVKLIPGDPHSALARSANGLTKTDLLIIAADQNADALQQAWFYVPRMLHEGSQVFLEEATDSENQPWRFRRLDRVTIEALACQAKQQKRRAA